MSRSASLSPEDLPPQADEPDDLDSQITSKRQQINVLQYELAQLEERQRAMERHLNLQTQTAPSTLVYKRSTEIRWLWVACTIGSLALASGGQAILLRTRVGMPGEAFRQILAGLLLISGALLFGALIPQLEGFPRVIEFSPERPAASASTGSNRFRLGWTIAAVGLSLIAVGSFAVNGESPIVVLIWIASMLALVISQLEKFRFKRPQDSLREHPYLILLALILVIALAMRVYHLTTLPYNFDGDFADVGLQARALITGEQPHIFAFGWAEIPMLGYLPSALTMKFLGDGLTGLNASGVVEGLLVIVGVYLLGRDLFHARVGLIAAALLTVSYAHLAASRQACYIDPVVFLVYAVYFLLLGLRKQKLWAIVVSSILTAFCLEMYYSGRIILAVIGFIFLFMLIFHRAWLKTRGSALALWGLGILIAFGPMLVVFARAPEALSIHTRSVFILDPEVVKHMQGVYQVDTLSAMLLQQLRHTALLFHYYNDTGTQFGFRRPFLDPFTAVLFTLGIGHALFHWRKFGYALVLTWTALGVLLGCFLTVNPPFWARLMILLPPTALLAALALNLIYEQIQNLFLQMGFHNKWMVPVLLAILIGATGILNWNTYTDLKGSFANARTRIGRYLAEQPVSTQAYLVSSDFTSQDREFRFLAPQRLIANLTPDQIDSGDSFDTANFIILTPEQAPLLSRLEQRFPAGTAETQIGNSPDEVAFYVFRMH